MITKQTATVFYSTKRKRRFFTEKAAIENEATAIIKCRYPTEKFDQETGAYMHWSCVPRADVMHRRLCRLIKKQLKNKGK